MGGSNGMLEGIGLNVGDGAFVVDRSGNVKIAGDIDFSDGKITWGNNAPVKYQFSTSISGPWHSAMQSGDKYRRDSLDGGATWGSPYQFLGTDGRNGSDAQVPDYIKKTYIDSVEIRSPTIKANDYYIYPYDESDYTGTFNIYGMHNQKQYHMFLIAYKGHRDGSYGCEVDMYSPQGAIVYLAGGQKSGTLYIGKGCRDEDAAYQYVHMCGRIDFSDAESITWGEHAPKAVFA